MEDNKEKNFSEETKEEKDIVMEETEDKKEMSEDKKPE